MADKIKLFESVQKHNRSMGVYLHHKPNSDDPEWSLNAKNLFVPTIAIQMAICTAAYAFREAETMSEYGACFYVNATAATTLSYYLIQLWQIKNILKLIEKFEGIIEKSKRKTTWIQSMEL